VDGGTLVTSCVIRKTLTRKRSILDGRMAELAAAGSPRWGGPFTAQRRHGRFDQKPHGQKADCQLAAKGAADAALEVSVQDRSKSAERSRRPAPRPRMTWHYMFRLLNFAAHSPRLAPAAGWEHLNSDGPTPDAYDQRPCPADREPRNGEQITLAMTLRPGLGFRCWLRRSGADSF